MGHNHDHGHQHGPGAGRTRLAVAFGISILIFLAQMIGAVLTGSLALLFDTVHVLTDAAGLAMALGAAVLSSRPATDHRTWGWKRVEILVAAVQATVLIVVGIMVIIEAVQRFSHPQPIADRELIVFGIVGLLGNIAAIVVLFGGEKNLNLRAAFLEVVNDALGSVAVIISALVIASTGWMQADAVVALLIGALIIPRAALILRESVSVLLESVPPGLDMEDVKRHLEDHPRVVKVHDLHASRISTDLPVLTAHVVLDDESFKDGRSAQLLCEIQKCISEHFDVSIAHSTIQLEPKSHYDHEAGEFVV
nr:cation diffusion facilitator family transporter [Kocuria sp. 36]